jgi:ABC-2 type transport system ATP-binding protein
MKLVIENLYKTYPNGAKALNGINLTIYQGMFGLLGPNGAGKSTLMRTIATLQDADQGAITMGDIDVLNHKEEVRKVLGYLPQEFGVYPKIDAITLLDYLAFLKGISNKSERKNQVEFLLQRTNLWSVRTKHLGTYSGGMKQRFGIAQALLANPTLIIVDEPTAGLDPAERNRFLNLLSEIGENAIVILSTHIVEDVKELCTQMAIINNGEVLYKGRPSEALARLEGKIWLKRASKTELGEIRKNFLIVSERLLAGTPEVHVLSDVQPDETFESIKPGLEDVYFSHILGGNKGNNSNAHFGS